MGDCDQEEHETPILWQANNSIEPRLTACPEWRSSGESMWMRLSKFSLYNRLTLHELSNLVLALPRKAIPKSGVDLRRADRFDLARLNDVLQISPYDMAASFCYSTPIPANASKELRYCPECVKQSFHTAWFQWRFIALCPLHQRTFKLGCPACRRPIPYALRSDMAEHPLDCSWSWRFPPRLEFCHGSASSSDPFQCSCFNRR